MARVGSEGYPVDNGPALPKSLRAIDGTPPENQVRTGLAGGGEWIRTISSARADTDVRMWISASKRPSLLTSSAIGR
jgi:hypothetical protein